MEKFDWIRTTSSKIYQLYYWVPVVYKWWYQRNSTNFVLALEQTVRSSLQTKQNSNRKSVLSQTQLNLLLSIKLSSCSLVPKISKRAPKQEGALFSSHYWDQFGSQHKKNSSTIAKKDLLQNRNSVFSEAFAYMDKGPPDHQNRRESKERIMESPSFAPKRIQDSTDQLLQQQHHSSTTCELSPLPGPCRIVNYVNYKADISSVNLASTIPPNDPMIPIDSFYAGGQFHPGHSQPMYVQNTCMAGPVLLSNPALSQGDRGPFVPSTNCVSTIPNPVINTATMTPQILNHSSSPPSQQPVAVISMATPTPSQVSSFSRPLATSQQFATVTTPGVLKFPCKARGIDSRHNDANAVIQVPSDAVHGTLLVCSHLLCASSGRRFRWCSVCKVPAAKRNFMKRHSHGLITSNRYTFNDYLKNEMMAKPSSTDSTSCGKGGTQQRKRESAAAKYKRPSTG